MELDRQFRIDGRGDSSGQIENGDRSFAADVEDSSGGPRRLHQGGRCVDDIGHVGEAAGLLAVIVDDERPPGQRGIDEPWQHHAVRAGLAGAHHVEEPADDDRQPALAEIRQGEEFIDRLRHPVRPARPGCRPEHQVVVFLVNRLGVLAVNLARARQKQLYLVPVLVHAPKFVEDDLGRVDIGFDRVDRRTGDQLHADRGGQVVDLVGREQPPAHQFAIRHRAAGVFEARMIDHFLQIVDRTGGFVINNGNTMSLSQQVFDQVTPDESGAAGHKAVFHSLAPQKTALYLVRQGGVAVPRSPRTGGAWPGGSRPDVPVAPRRSCIRIS